MKCASKHGKAFREIMSESLRRKQYRMHSVVVHFIVLYKPCKNISFLAECLEFLNYLHSKACRVLKNNIHAAHDINRRRCNLQTPELRQP